MSSLRAGCAHFVSFQRNRMVAHECRAYDHIAWMADMITIASILSGMLDVTLSWCGFPSYPVLHAQLALPEVAVLHVGPRRPAACGAHCNAAACHVLWGGGGRQVLSPLPINVQLQACPMIPRAIIVNQTCNNISAIMLSSIIGVINTIGIRTSTGRNRSVRSEWCSASSHVSYWHLAPYLWHQNAKHYEKLETSRHVSRE